MGTIGSILWKLGGTRIRGFIEELREAELDAALGRDRYERPRVAKTGVGGRQGVGAGHRHGHRERQLMGSFGPVTVRVPRARLETSDSKTVEWKNATIPAYQRRTKQADALIAGAYLAGTNTRRVRRALAALFGGAVGKDTVSDQADAYDELVDPVTPLRIGKPSEEGWLLGLDGVWFRCSVQAAGPYGALMLTDMAGEVIGGMSGSPIVSAEGAASGVACLGGSANLGQGPQPSLVRKLPGWLLTGASGRRA